MDSHTVRNKIVSQPPRYIERHTASQTDTLSQLARQTDTQTNRLIHRLTDTHIQPDRNTDSQPTNQPARQTDSSYLLTLACAACTLLSTCRTVL